ncbi:zinc-binding dehydrogenase [Dickeya dianthicola]|nr:zinc-binding dehydrogenase [Dickeya dianthicola]MBI0449198.1 zinc-binding dehydrogenase [Dickeya dianthicola]MBI0453702.1 zinc-binding dehydrogenase [Dickeya dianthicola]MBI0457994.1 zinc-binding dehydrogenase [Dickeya dianthicola]MBI0462663.1 zinc-binding dehydrogenase [Dickeya dianthicola]
MLIVRCAVLRSDDHLNAAALTKDGQLLLIGFLGGVVEANVNLLTLAVKHLTVTDSRLRARSRREGRDRTRPEHKGLVLVRGGRCLRTVHAKFPRARAADAHRMMESNDHIGKIVLCMANKEQYWWDRQRLGVT